MPTDTTVVNRDTIKKIHLAGDLSKTANDVIKKIASSELVQPGGILGATAQPALVPFGLEHDDEEPA